MAACWPLQMPPTPKAVLMSLADNANDHGVCWPSVSTISMRTCFGRTAVIDAIAWLEAQGLLIADRAAGRSTKYQIVPAADLFPREKPVRLADQSASRTSSAGVPDQSASRTTPVRQADPNRKEPSGTVKKKEQSLDFASWPSEPSPQVLADWLDLRKRKRAPVTDTAMRGMGAQLHRALALGYDVDAALTECVLRGWQGLNADWLQPTNRTRAGPAPQPGKQMQGLMALEAMKSGNRMADGRGADGIAEAMPALTGRNAGR
jgi:hypothetical protein